MARAKAGDSGARVWRVEQGRVEARADRLATEEPLEIRLRWPGGARTVAVTMRTPGADEELAAGFLFAEGIVDRPERIAGFRRPGTPDTALGEADPNALEVELGDGPEPDLPSLERHFFASSACGVCGKASLAALRPRVPGELPAGPVLPPATVAALPARLRESQGLFQTTGGLHAAALFDPDGRLLAVREDVGRHNALDKLLGRAFLDGATPLSERLVLVSGRSSYEILQKCLMAGVPVVCAVSAPSSLAVELAESFGATLIGFLRGDRFNVYSGIERIAGARDVRDGRAGRKPSRPSPFRTVL
jgi:FdhD protein